jgi:hypothetical protein
MTSSMKKRSAHEPLFEINPWTGASVEVFYADRELETFGRSGSGWFWWPRRRGFSPDGLPTGPFAKSYGAYRHAVGLVWGPIAMSSKTVCKLDGFDDSLAEREGIYNRIAGAATPKLRNTTAPA